MYAKISQEQGIVSVEDTIEKRGVITTIKVDDRNGFHELQIFSNGRLAIRSMSDNHAGALDEFVDPKFADYLAGLLYKVMDAKLKKENGT